MGRDQSRTTAHRLRLPSPALAVATMALIVAVGGGAFAVASSHTTVVRIARRVANAQIERKAPSLSVKHADSADSASSANHANGADSATIATHAKTADTATNATHAGAADSATNAGHAGSADTATNASELEGSPGTDYRLHCPNTLHRAADLCFEMETRPAATYETALVTCARAQMRLPDDGELALVFDHLGASQPPQWVVSHYYEKEGTGPVAPLLLNNAIGVIEFNADNVTQSHPYRCVTSASN